MARSIRQAQLQHCFGKQREAGLVAASSPAWLTAGGGMEADWRRIVEAHRPQIVLKIKQKLENLVAPGGDECCANWIY